MTTAAVPQGKDKIHVAVAFDEHYVQQFKAWAASLVQQHRRDELIVHAITSGLDKETVGDIRDFIQRSGTIIFYSIEKDTLTKFTLSGRWTSAVYYRLYFPFLVPPDVGRLLYLDTDTLTIKNLKELFNTDLGDKPVGAVYDNYVKTQPEIGIHEPGEYFNSGMLLIDLDRWRHQRISEKAMDYLSEYPERIKFVDQCALNAVLKDNWKKMDMRFNLLYSYIPQPIGRETLKSFLSDKVIVHFTVQRPWNMLCKNRLRELYFYYLKKFPGRTGSPYTDFSWSKIPSWIGIRVIEFYFDIPLLQKWWRRGKGSSV